MPTREKATYKRGPGIVPGSLDGWMDGEAAGEGTTVGCAAVAGTRTPAP